LPKLCSRCFTQSREKLHGTATPQSIVCFSGRMCVIIAGLFRAEHLMTNDAKVQTEMVAIS
jgi:hypothetical protein